MVPASWFMNGSIFNKASCLPRCLLLHWAGSFPWDDWDNIVHKWVIRLLMSYWHHNRDELSGRSSCSDGASLRPASVSTGADQGQQKVLRGACCNCKSPLLSYLAAWSLGLSGELALSALCKLGCCLSAAQCSWHAHAHAQTDSGKRVTIMMSHVLNVCGRAFPVAACKLHNGNLWACFHLGAVIKCGTWVTERAALNCFPHGHPERGRLLWGTSA